MCRQAVASPANQESYSMPLSGGTAECGFWGSDLSHWQSVPLNVQVQAQSSGLIGRAVQPVTAIHVLCICHHSRLG